MPLLNLKACVLGFGLALSLPLLAEQHQAHTSHEVHGAEAVKGSYAATLMNLAIGQPWSRALPPTAQTGAVFVTIHNQGPDERLLAASSPIANKVELHTHLMQGDLMQMVQVESIEIIGHGGQQQLKPGGYHIMLIGLQQQLREGERFPLRLSFANSGEIELQVEVRSLDAGTAAEHAHHH